MSWRIVRGWVALCSLVLSLVFATTTPAQPPEAKTEDVADARAGGTVAKGQLLVTLHAGVKEDELKAIFARFDAKYEIVGRLPALNQVVLQTDHERLPELRLRLANHPYIAAVGFNTIHTLRQQSTVKKPDVNDPVFAKPNDKLVDDENWNLYRIKVPEAWEITKGGALIAIVDSGVKLDHEELIGRTLDPRTFAPNVEAREGVKKLREGTQIVDGEVRDHGTHVSITAAGTANNGVGTAGVAPNSPILPIQSLYYRPSATNDGTGVIRGDTNQLIAGIEWAVNQGAAVVNCSFGNNLSDEEIKRWRDAATPEAKQQVENELLPRIAEEMLAYAPVLDLANRRGTIIVVSAGNQNMPAHLYALPLSQRVIVVAAIDDKDLRCGFSNFGPYTNVSAPGNLIFSGLARETKDRGFYGKMSGTSMAAPHVTGVVALMKTLDPGLKHADVVDILMSTGTQLDPNQQVGPLVNAKAALEETKRRRDTRQPRLPEPPPLTPAAPPEPVLPTPPVPGQPPPVDPVLPALPPNPITIIEQPDPWNSVYIQQIIQVWLSMAIATPPAGGPGDGIWVYNRFGQVINIRVSITAQQPVWFAFQYRWLWENSMVLQSTNMGSLYEFIVGTLRQGRFNPAPRRVPEQFRPKPTDPKPRQTEGLPFDPALSNTKWSGKNAKNETIELVFGKGIVAITRGGKTVRYRVVINTYMNPITVDLFPEEKGDPILGLIRVTGLGEFLFRTDFTKTRPTSISRADQLAFVLKRTDIEVKDPGATADGVELPVLYRGTESLIRNLDYPKLLDPKTAWGAAKQYRVHTYTLSGDGKRLWLVLFNPDEKELANRVQVWSMNAEGGDAKQTTFSWPEHTGTVEKIATSTDGSIAWLHTRHKNPNTNDSHAFMQKLTPGGKAEVVIDTIEVKGITHVMEWRLTADGRAALMITNEGLMRVEDSGKHHVLLAKKEIEYKKMSAADGGYFAHLVMSADGSHWAVTARMKPYINVKSPSAVVIGSPQGHKMIVEENKDGTFDDYRRLSMSGDGSTLLVEKKGETRMFRNGQVVETWSEASGMYNGLLSADGRAMYASWRPVGGGGDYPVTPYIEDLRTGQRRRAMTGALATRWDTWWTRSDIGYIQMSTDGTVVTSMPEGQGGLYLFRGGAAPSGHHPTIKSVRQRYEGEYLVITVEAAAPDKLGKLWVLPMKDGALLPSWLVKREQNPLAWVDHRRVLAPVEKRPGVYEARAWVGRTDAYIDSSYSFRITVANAEETRTTFQDYPVLK